MLACTPLGMWLYEDPRVSVSRVRVGAGAPGSAPVLVALHVRNPNDYVLSTTRIELRLSLDDLPIGWLDRDSSVALPMGVATVALPLVPDRATTPARLRTFRTGVHRFVIEGRATLETPVGRRRVRFAQAGEMAFGSPASPASAPTGPGGSR